jgi:hypothetical protein
LGCDWLDSGGGFNGCSFGCLLFWGDVQYQGAHGNFDAVLAVGHARFAGPFRELGLYAIVHNEPVRVWHFNI